jgi:LysM repeat protein
VVKRNESVFGIATRYDTTVEALQQMNPNLSGPNPMIFPGEQIKVRGTLANVL